MRADRCVCCGAVIPEGTQVCPSCAGKSPIITRKPQIMAALHCRGHATVDRRACDGCDYRTPTGCNYSQICDDVIELLRWQDKMIIGIR